MVISVFLILLLLSIVFIIAGKYIEAPAIQMAGWTFMFLLGVIVMSGNLQYTTGAYEQENNYYVCGCCMEGEFYYNDTQICIEGEELVLLNTTKQTLTNYTAVTGEIIPGVDLHHVFGLLLSVIAGFGFVIVLLNLDKFSINSRGMK